MTHYIDLMFSLILPVDMIAAVSKTWLQSVTFSYNERNLLTMRKTCIPLVQFLLKHDSQLRADFKFTFDDVLETKQRFIVCFSIL